MVNEEPKCINMNKVTYTASKFTIHKFLTEVAEKKILIQVIKMTDSVVIYINEKDQPYCHDLVLALQDRFGAAIHITSLLTNIAENTSNSIAARLARKLNKAVFLSLNLQCGQDRFLVPSVEKRLFEEIQERPDCF